MNGDPLIRFTDSASHGDQQLSARVRESFQYKPLHVVLLRLPEALLAKALGVAMLVGVGLTLVAGAVTKSKAVLLLCAWIALYWFVLTLLGGALDPATPRLRIQKIRYWFPIFPAILVGGVAAVYVLAEHLLAWKEEPSDYQARSATALAVGLAAVAAVLGMWAIGTVPAPTGQQVGIS